MSNQDWEMGDMNKKKWLMLEKMDDLNKKCVIRILKMGDVYWTRNSFSFFLKMDMEVALVMDGS